MFVFERELGHGAVVACGRAAVRRAGHTKAKGQFAAQNLLHTCSCTDRALVRGHLPLKNKPQRNKINNICNVVLSAHIHKLQKNFRLDVLACYLVNQP